MEQKKQIHDILNELLAYSDVERNDKCISLKLCPKTYDSLDLIAKKHGCTFSKMLHNVFLNLMSQIIYNKYVFSPNLSEFNFKHEIQNGKPVTLHLTHSVFQELCKITLLNHRNKSTLAIYAALTCLKEKQDILDINYYPNPFKLDFKL